MSLRCLCGYQLTYETDICPVCLPQGLPHGLPRVPRKADGLKVIADFLGLTTPTEDAILARIEEICIVRDKYEELERMYCEDQESLSDRLVRCDADSERMFNAGYENGLGVAIQAIEHEKEERTAYHAWDGMKRAIEAVRAVKNDTFVWVESDKGGV